MKRLVLLLSVLVVLVASAARADDHRPPRATLHVAGKVQEGHRYHADGWSTSSEPGYCDISFATGFSKFGKPIRRTSRDEIVVRLHKPAMPREVEAQSWPRVNDDGQAAGQPTPLPWALRPHITGGGITAWEVVVLAPSAPGHLYLGVGAYWADEDGCSGSPLDLGSQYAAWNFHVLTR
ncbi:MAG: hypothetical protein M3N53_06615 [Actinomycetota bacterium]|nr:hypothetical protein [Actinomycetota bacterium]